MTSDTPHLHHAFDYVEIPTHDIGAAERFYGDAFGWHFTAYGPGYLGIVSPDGRRFHFTDPSGNELGVWTRKEEEGSLI